MWGKRRLAYEVDRLRDGHYVITLLQLDGTKVADLERALQIHDTVFRHLLVRGDETVPAAEDGAVPAAEDGAVPEPGDGDPVTEAALPSGEDDAADDAADEEDNTPPAEIAEGDEE
jgi:hypothetical protein